METLSPKMLDLQSIGDGQRNYAVFKVRSTSDRAYQCILCLTPKKVN
jgi:hypothetical protein